MRQEAPASGLVQRWRDKSSGIHWGNVVLTVAVMAAMSALLAWMLLGFRTGENGSREAAAGGRAIDFPITDYSQLEEKPAPWEVRFRPPSNPPPPDKEPKTDVVVRSEMRHGKTSKPDKLMQEAMLGNMGVILIDLPEASPDAAVEVHGRTPSDPDGTDFVPGSVCQVNAGTMVPAKLESAVATGLGGTVRARVDRDVYDTATGTCLAIPFGSLLVGEVKRAEVQGQRRADLLFTSITRPWPRNDTLRIHHQAHDAAGRSGIPGRVNSNLLSTGAFVLAATAIDLASYGLLASSSGAWGVLGGILMGNANRPLNRAASDRLALPPILEVDPQRDEPQLTVVFQEPINADEFRR